MRHPVLSKAGYGEWVVVVVTGLVPVAVSVRIHSPLLIG
jgi:hypothetical protein